MNATLTAELKCNGPNHPVHNSGNRTQKTSPQRTHLSRSDSCPVRNTRPCCLHRLLWILTPSKLMILSRSDVQIGPQPNALTTPTIKVPRIIINCITYNDHDGSVWLRGLDHTESIVINLGIFCKTYQIQFVLNQASDVLQEILWRNSTAITSGTIARIYGNTSDG